MQFYDYLLLNKIHLALIFRLKRNFAALKIGELVNWQIRCFVFLMSWTGFHHDNSFVTNKINTI